MRGLFCLAGVVRGACVCVGTAWYGEMVRLRDKWRRTVIVGGAGGMLSC
jgi:hypothetical protein